MNSQSTLSSGLRLHPLMSRLASVALLCVAAPAAFAQAAPDLTHAVAIAEKKTLFDKIMLAGPFFMLVLFLASVFMVWLVIDGILKTRRTVLIPPAAVAAVRQHLSNGHYGYAA